MEHISTIVRYILIALAVIICGGLAGWYFFLRSAEQSTAAANAARGYNSPTPSFQSPSTGSTFQNSLSVLGSSVSSGASSSTTSQLWHAEPAPIAGFGFVSASNPTLYFVERSTGYVFSIDLKTRETTRLTNTLRPKTYQALFTNDGSVVERGLDQNGAVTAFAGSASTSTTAGATSSVGDLVGTALPENIGAMTVDPQTRTLYYLIDTASGAGLVSSDWTLVHEKHLASLPIVGWQLFASNGSVVLAENAADGVPGYAYRLQKDGSLALIAHGPGLTVLPSATSSALIFGLSSGGNLQLFSQTSAQANPVQTSLQTIASKCAWAPGNMHAYCGVPQTIPSQQFLDDWYKGIVHSSDQIWAIDVSAGSTTLLSSPQADLGVSLDVDAPAVDPSGQYLAFMNAADQSLWVFDLSQ